MEAPSFASVEFRAQALSDRLLPTVCDESSIEDSLCAGRVTVQRLYEDALILRAQALDDRVPPMCVRSQALRTPMRRPCQIAEIVFRRALS